MTLRLYPALLACAALLSGCLTQKPIAPELSVVNVPEPGEVREAAPGEFLLQKGKVYVWDALRLENPVSAGDGFILKKFSLEPGILRAKSQDEERRFYTSDKLAVYDALLGTTMNNGGLAVGRRDTNDVVFHWNGRLVFRPKPTPVLTRIQVADTDRPGSRQELVYNGRSGAVLSFLYREYSSDLLQPPSAQAGRHDLKDGTTIQFKGAKIVVLEATDARIRYRVEATFQDPM